MEWVFTTPPFEESSLAVSSSTPPRRPQIHTSAPSSTYFAAISFPRPVPPPVMRMRLPFRRPSLNMRAPGGGSPHSKRSYSTTAASRMAHRLYVVAVGVDEKCRVIGRAVIGSQTGLPVVAPAGLEARGVEPVDRLTVGRAERDVKGPAFTFRKPQTGLALRSQASSRVVEYEAKRRGHTCASSLGA